MILRPSNAHQWANCPGSVALSSHFPEIESEEAREGTAGHFYATEYLQGREWPLGYVTPNGVPIDAEMIDGGRVLIDMVSVIMTAHPGAHLYVERMVYAHGSIHPKVEGTPDIVIIDFSTRQIWLIDFKYGHLYVEVFNNFQMLCYLAGIIEGVELSPIDLASWKITVAIVQPRYYAAAPVRYWYPDVGTLWEWFSYIGHRAETALKPDAPTYTGDWCLYCPARHACDAMMRSGGMAITLSGMASPLVLDNKQVAAMLSTVQVAQERLTALQTGLAAFAENEIRSGRAVPGYEMTPSSNKEDWIFPAADIIALGHVAGIDLAKPAAPVTPNQARKAGLPSHLTDIYAKRKPGALVLKRTDPYAAQKAFG